MNAISLHVLAGVAVAGSLFAQAPGGQALAGLRVPIHTAEDDMGVPYGTWGAGDTYKASFHDGMTFVPYLGADYPHNQPWSWRTTSVKLGETELLEGGVAPLRRQQDYRYEYRFGAVTEAYDVQIDGLEQTFVVHQRPATGDLVVTGAITSQLHAPQARPGHQSLTFVDAAGVAVVGYGKAFAFDSNGDHVPVTTAHRDGEIVLTVPGSWLANAALPVTVDPLLTRVWLFTSSQTHGRADIGHEYESTSRNVMIVYTRAASQYDDDAFARVHNSDFTGGALVFSDLTTNWDSDSICCAFVGGADRWAIVFRRYFAGNPIRRSNLRCRVHPAGSTSLGTTVGAMNPPAGINDWRPDVGGIRSLANGDKALVVFQREDNSNTAGHWANVPNSAIYSSLVTISSNPAVFGTPVEVYGSPGGDGERPSVNQVSEGVGGPGWACAWQVGRPGVAGDDWDVLAREIDYSGSRTSNYWSSDLGALNTHHQLAPVIAGYLDRYAVAFTTVDLASVPTTSGSTGKEVRIERFDWISPSPDYPTVVLASDNSRIFETSGVAIDLLDGSHFAVSYRTIFAPVNGAYGVRVGYNGQLTEGPFTLSAVAGQSTSAPTCTFDRDHGDFLFSYFVRNSSTTSLYGHALEYVTPTPWSNSGAGCSLLPITWVGNQQIGAGFNGLRVSGATPTTGHILVVSLATVDVGISDPGVGAGCRLLVDATGPGFLGTMPLRFGTDPFWRFSLPEWLPPMTLHFQDWVLDGSQFEGTRRLSVPVIK